MSAKRSVTAIDSARVPAPATPGVIVITHDELARLVREAVRAELAARPAETTRLSDWIDADEAARLLGVSRDYLRKVKALRRYGSPRTPRFRRDEVEALLAANKPLGR